MKNWRAWTAAAVLLSCAPLTGSRTHSHLVSSHALPHLDGSRLEVKVVEVAYPPGQSSPAHSHPCPVVVFVMEGAVRTQVKGEAERIYTAGQSFYEAPGGAHLISANASNDAPAKFLAFFICDRETPLSIPVSAGTQR